MIVNTAWVATFNDTQLDALVLEGLQNNLELKAATSRIDAAAGLATQARSLLYPQVAISGGAGLVGRDDVKDRSGINEDHRVYFHKVGTPQSQDRQIYQDAANGQRFHIVQTTDAEWQEPVL